MGKGSWVLFWVFLAYPRIGSSVPRSASPAGSRFKNPKMSSIFRTMSRRSSDSQDTVVNSEEINYPKIQNDLDDWNLEQDDQVIRLLDNRSIEKHKKDGYNFIHFGMIQVAAKPLTRLVYPNFTVRIRDADILDSVVLHIKTHGFKIKPGNSPVFNHNQHSVLKVLNKLFNIHGGGELVFSNSFRHSSSPRVSVYEPSRASSSSIPVRTTREEEGSSSGNPKNIKLTGVRSHTNVARPFYSEENESTQESQQDESPVMSPTYSQMINTISLSDEDFEINKDLLRKDFYSEVNKQRNDWFFSTVPKFEERNQYTQASYTSGTIYEWNIDGMTEYNILTKLQEMTMVSLRDEDGQDIEDAVATLIYSISKHFIGDPAKIKDKTADLLTNLKCPKLHDFRWYKEVFLTKVMLRSDCNQSFWKEKFISGLPKLFSERIRIKIREQYNGQIPYDKLTYGEIISIVTAEGIKLCNDFKLKQQMKNEQKIYKNEFGSFCSQFGFSQKETMPPSKQKPSRKPSKDKFYHSKRGTYDNYRMNDTKHQGTSKEGSTKIPRKRFDQQSPKEVSIKELHEEVKQYKKEIKELRQFIRAAENCLQEGLVPIPLCEETSQSLFGANGKRLAIKYKLTDVHIRNHDICIKQTFILVKDLKEKALLGIPFLSSIYPLWVDNQANPVKATQYPAISGSQTFKQVTKANPSQKELASSSSFSNKQIVNRDFHHSWMFYFPSKNQLSSFPFWFYSWWTYYGPTIKILPKPILDGFELFRSSFDIPENFQLFPFTILFSKFGLAWIVQWDYIIITDESAAFHLWEGLLKLNVSASDDMSQFLLKKQQLQAMLVAAKTPQDFQKILEEGSSSFSQENSYAEAMWEGSWVLFWVFLAYPRIGSSVPGERALPVEPLLAVDRRLLGCKRVGVTSHKIIPLRPLKCVSLEQDDQVIRLLDNRSVEKHKKDGYNFIHFGMIQVAAKPLTRLGLNTAIVMCLRDNRHLEYRDSIIGAVQAGLNDGPVYFQYMLDKSDFIIPKKILWKDVDFPENWHFANAVPAIAQRSESIEQIVQYPDGGGELVSPNLSDIPAALEFLFMNPLELQALPSQLEPLGKKKDPAQEILRTLS
ncbi:hypothetical protein CK203_038862 [Vitis vinifera]|uniref:DUF7746 domain-containing protein n=1 Tax=Vitis vinifera TaxID=29760 RepID=A0A438HFU2_VITVI|nr:hypothetical protein CK203_038862 [Vitis vinifera]